MQAVGHVVPSKNLPTGQLRQWPLLPPEQVAQSAWHKSHVFVAVLANLPAGQTVGHWVPNRYLLPEQLKQ